MAERSVTGRGAAARLAPAQSFPMRAVEEQRNKLINVLGALQCMQLAIRNDDPPAELEGAVALLGDEVQRIVTALEGPELMKATESCNTRKVQP